MSDDQFTVGGGRPVPIICDRKAHVDVSRGGADVRLLKLDTVHPGACSSPILMREACEVLYHTPDAGRLR